MASWITMKSEYQTGCDFHDNFKESRSVNNLGRFSLCDPVGKQQGHPKGSMKHLHFRQMKIVGLGWWICRTKSVQQRQASGTRQCSTNTNPASKTISEMAQHFTCFNLLSTIFGRLYWLLLFRFTESFPPVTSAAHQ